MGWNRKKLRAEDKVSAAEAKIAWNRYLYLALVSQLGDSRLGEEALDWQYNAVHTTNQ